MTGMMLCGAPVVNRELRERRKHIQRIVHEQYIEQLKVNVSFSWPVSRPIFHTAYAGRKHIRTVGDYQSRHILTHPDKYLCPPLPRYSSWDEYIKQCPEREIQLMCMRRAAVANRRTAGHVTTADIMRIMTVAKGHCCYCDSLAVEIKPYPRKTPWLAIGRRIGTIEHLLPVAKGGTNALDNLAWACFYCNCTCSGRIPGATDHGALYPALTITEMTERTSLTYIPGVAMPVSEYGDEE